MSVTGALIIALGIVIAAVIVAAGGRYAPSSGAIFDRWTGNTYVCGENGCARMGFGGVQSDH